MTTFFKETRFILSARNVYVSVCFCVCVCVRVCVGVCVCVRVGVRGCGSGLSRWYHWVMGSILTTLEVSPLSNPSGIFGQN